MNRLRFESRLAGRSLHELRCFRQLEIHQLAAAVTDSVIVTFGLAIVATGAVAKTDFVYEPGFLEITQRVIDGGVADAGQTAPRRRKDVAGGGMIFSFADHL